MDKNDDRRKLEAILMKYDDNIRKIYSDITKLEGNTILKKTERRAHIKDLIVKEVTKNAD